MKISEESELKYDLVVAPKFAIRLYEQPNWFHRLMQRLILGFKWEKIEDEPS